MSTYLLPSLEYHMLLLPNESSQEEEETLPSLDLAISQNYISSLTTRKTAM